MNCYLMLHGDKLIAFIITELFRVNKQNVKKKLLERVTILDSRLCELSRRVIHKVRTHGGGRVVQLKANGLV